MEKYKAIFVFIDGTSLSLYCKDNDNLVVSPFDKKDKVHYEVKDEKVCLIEVDGKIKVDNITICLNNVKYFMD